MQSPDLAAIDHDIGGGLSPVPLTILTGFLGAGKTTLLNRIINGNHGLRVAVLVNDFGSINIDADLVVGVEGDVVSLANGCVCCSIRDDLMDAVRQVLARPERPEYVVLEASGVAEPAGIAMTFNNAGIRDGIRLDSITCVLDAEQVFAAPEQMALKLWQIAASDMLILNKVDLVDRDRVAKIRVWLDDHFHRYRLIEATQSDVPLEVLLSCGRFDATQLDTTVHQHDEHACGDPGCEHPIHRHNHTQAFGTWSYETAAPLSLARLREAAMRFPANIYRCKGVINSAESPTRRAILQVVGKRVDITLDSEWGARTPQTQIVLIGAEGALDGDVLRRRFDACLATDG